MLFHQLYTFLTVFIFDPEIISIEANFFRAFDTGFFTAPGCLIRDHPVTLRVVLLHVS